jgi:hypothetical protein
MCVCVCVRVRVCVCVCARACVCVAYVLGDTTYRNKTRSWYVQACSVVLSSPSFLIGTDQPQEDLGSHEGHVQQVS